MLHWKSLTSDLSLKNHFASNRNHITQNDNSNQVWENSLLGNEHLLVSLASLVKILVQVESKLKSNVKRRKFVQVKLWGEGHYYKNQNVKNQKNIKKFVKHHYIESVFLVHHYYNIRTSKSIFLVDHYIENYCLFSSSLRWKSEHRK